MRNSLLFTIFALIFVASVSSAAVTVTFPANGTNTTNSSLEIFFVVTTQSMNYTNYTIVIDNATATTGAVANNTAVAYNFTPLTNGTHIFYIEARNSTDNSSGTNSSLTYITVDNVAPGVTITSPANGTNTSSSTPQIFFNITDNVFATNLTYRIYRDGAMQTANDTNNNTNIAYNFTALTNGTHNFTVEVTDPAGNVFNASFMRITVDNVNPGVTITSPANGTNTSSSTPQIFFNVSDNVFATNLTYRIYMDSVMRTANDTNNNTNIAYNFTALTNGTHRFTVEVTDPAGNVFNASLVTITVDNVKPGVTITSPANATNTTNSSIEMRFGITDNVFATNLTYRIYRDGAMQTANDTNNNTNIAYNFTALTNGTHQFAVEGTDPAGNVFNASLTITVDNVAPGVTITSPANGTNTSSSTPQIFFNITDNVFATNLTYRIYMDSVMRTANDTNNNTNIAYNFTALTNGTHRFTVEVTDPAGNVFNASLVTITVDNVKPGVTITSPGNSTNTTVSTPQIFFNITDNVFATNLTYRIYMDSVMRTANDTNNNTNIAYNFTALTNGTHRFTVEVTDPAGNVFNASLVTITVDNVAPAVNINYPANDSIVADTTPEIRFNITDNVFATNLTYRIFVSGGEAQMVNDTTNNTNIAYNLSTLTEGAWIITVEATDPSGNVANSSITIKQTGGGSSSTTSSSSSSSGGSTPNPATKSSWDVLPAGITTVTVDKSGIAFDSIKLDTKNAVNNAKLTIEKVSGVDATMAAAMTGTAYQYVEITKENVQNSDLNGATITFTVPKSWLTANSFTKSNVVLMRYTTKWDELSTAIASESSSDVTFSAATPGFSTFAIAARTAAPITTTTTPTGGSATTTTVPETTTTTLPPLPARGVDYTLLAVAALIVIAFAAYAFRRKLGMKGILGAHYNATKKHWVPASFRFAPV